MTNESFTAMMEARLVAIRETLGRKAKEYAGPADRLHNFKRGAEVLGEDPAQTCLGLFVKHLVSVMDIVDEVARTQNPPDTALLDEKLGDAINYLVLLEAILKETD